MTAAQQQTSNIQRPTNQYVTVVSSQRPITDHRASDQAIGITPSHTYDNSSNRPVSQCPSLKSPIPRHSSTAACASAERQAALRQPKAKSELELRRSAVGLGAATAWERRAWGLRPPAMSRGLRRPGSDGPQVVTRLGGGGLGACGALRPGLLGAAARTERVKRGEARVKKLGFGSGMGFGLCGVRHAGRGRGWAGPRKRAWAESEF